MQKGLLQQQMKQGSVAGSNSTIRQAQSTEHSRSGEYNSEFLDCLDMVDDVLLTKMIEKLELQSLQTLPDLSQFFRKGRRQYQLGAVRRAVPTANR